MATSLGIIFPKWVTPNLSLFIFVLFTTLQIRA